LCGQLKHYPQFSSFAAQKTSFLMALIKSISGIRGTIGGRPNDNLTPLDIVKFSSAYGVWLKKNVENNKPSVVIGRDGRISGKLVNNIVVSTLNALGINVIDTGFSTTPTVEMAVTSLKADGGIILTASHNPKEWNALKLLNNKGEFISGDAGAEILEIAANDDFDYADVDNLGTYVVNDTTIDSHINAILKHKYVDALAIAAANFKIVVDVVNSTGAIAIPALLDKLGVKDYTLINSELTGNFAHNPEPLPEHLVELSRAVVAQQAHLGIAVDPDVDRLCFVCEDGTMFGEEYTLVAVADYILSKQKGNTVSNMSSTRALRDVTQKHGGTYYASAVGEVNVVNKMKEVKAIIGGEGNGGIIDPALHYGRDAMVGIGLFLTQLAKSGKTIKQLRNTYPNYFMSKNKIALTPNVNAKDIFASIQEKYKKQEINTEDGLKIDFEDGWVQLRTSNTEPIIRIYTEAHMETTAENMAKQFIKEIQERITN
jgi:phosphomannomutase